MTQAAHQLELISPLAEFLQTEFSADNLARTLELPPELPEQLWQRALENPLASIAEAGGKELRGQLVSIAWQMAGGRAELPRELSAIVEALHVGSLIIDDIEDDSARRRGAPTLHRRVGVPLALNAGNWLYFWPTVLIARLGMPPATELALRRSIDRAVLDCHYGQALDLSVRVSELRQREVADVVLTTTRLKTGSLMALSARVGALAAGANATTLQALSALGSELGIALQMLDDLSGLTSQRRCHKGHEDLTGGRPTWVWAWLAEQADSVLYCRLRAIGEEVVARDTHPEHLALQLREIVAEHGAAAIQRRVSSAISALTQALGEPRGLGELTHWVERLVAFNG